MHNNQVLVVIRAAYAILFPMQTALHSGATFSFEENPHSKTKLTCPDNGYVSFSITLLPQQAEQKKMSSEKVADDSAILLQNLDKLHTTELGAERIRKNLALDISGVAAVTAWCKEKTATAKHIERQGKNWYATIEDAMITVNAHSYTIITAHKIKDAVIKNITPADYPLLEDFLYHAIFVPQGVEPPPYSLIYDPEIYIYADDFGTKPSDYGVMAWAQGKAVGAAWVRVIPAYGHIDDNTPELAISLLPDYRRQGIGTVMMERLFWLLKEHGYKQTSLNVQKDNPALRFYGRLGYKTVSERADHAGNEDYTMIKNL